MGSRYQTKAVPRRGKDSEYLKQPRPVTERRSRSILKRPALQGRLEPKRPRLRELAPTKRVARSPGAEDVRRLDLLTARVLEDEVQNIMVKVWQELPYDPDEVAEREVAEKLYGEAGDDLRNVLGLNVTKRLLDSFNPLNVKVHFSTKPERKYLRLFLNRYHFVAFKRIARVDNTFAAQVRSIGDYDRLCADTNIHCGAAKIRITPYYRFRQCPKDVRCMYYTPDAYKFEDATSDDARESNDAVVSKTNSPKGRNKESKDTTAQVSKDEGKSQSKAATNVKQVENTTEECKDKPKAKTVPAKSEVDKPITKETPKSSNINTTSAQKTEAKNIAVKVVETKSSQNETSKPLNTTAKPTTNVAQAKPTPKSTPATATETSKDAAVKTTSKDTSVERNPKVTPANATTKASTANTTLKEAPAKTTPKESPVKTTKRTPQITPKQTPQTAPNKTPAKNTPKANSANSTPKRAPAKPTPKVVARKPVEVAKPKAKAVATTKAKAAVKPTVKKTIAKTGTVKKVETTKHKSSKKSDDFEELDDEAILALMSGGIVLDECCGSDDE